MCRFLFLPISSHAPPLRPGDTCALAREEGSLAVPTAHTHPGTRFARVASICPCTRRWQGPRLSNAPHRPRQETQGKGGVSLPPGTPHLAVRACGHPCHIRVCVCVYVCIPLRVLCPSVCARVRKISKASSPSTEIRAPPKQNRDLPSTPFPSQSSPLFFLPPAIRARF